ncbi:efflux RND transporter permease subunit [Desulfonatronovibrio hydrogenovorans]|uniref:efflux RND transporter permease subunit n=1 Tax=Desulfonatronovibrio hydrogenovorans TaxID=53245 RepID=UPI00048DE7BF|nr:efflux RND transporter permease subunit [Desulfonatronovibrio hydrogenovorans]
MKNLTIFSVARPVFVTMATFIVLILGAISLSRVPIDLMPDITYPTLSVRTSYSHAGPEEVETLITRPLERAFSAVPGVEEIYSRSTEGLSDIRITFAWGTDLDAAANDLRDRLDRVIASLPDDADRPALRKFDLASFPILILGASSRLDPVETRRLIEDEVRYRVERVPGVASLDIRGGLDREIHVDLIPGRIQALGLTLDEIIRKVREANINLPAGILESGPREISIRTLGEFTDLDELGRTIIAVHEGSPVRLRDIADIKDSWERVTRIVRVNGQDGVRLAVNKQSGTNTVEVASQVLQEIERINQDIPQLRIIPIIDTSQYIQRSISNVTGALFYGSFFAVLVLLFFLRSIRGTAIVGAAIPIAIVATFIIIYFGGFTINLMTLGGLALGVGMLVDNSIVVLENIHRHREGGTPPVQAAIKGSGEVAAAITASTLTTLAVFVPLIFVRGMAGVMFSQLAYVVGFALLCSLAVALTLVPMLSSKFLIPVTRDKSQDPCLKNRLYAMSCRFFASLDESYRSILSYCLRHRFQTIGLAGLLLAGSLALIPLIGTEMMPQTDEGEVRINLEMDVGSKLSDLDAAALQVEQIIRNQVPEIDSLITMLGGAGWRFSGSHLGEIRISLKEQRYRERSSQEVAADLRSKLNRIPGVTIRTRAGQGLFILRLGTSDGDRIEVEIRGYDLDTAQALAERVQEIVENVQGVGVATISRESGMPEERIIVNRDRAESMGVTVSTVGNAVQTVLSGTVAGNFRDQGDEYSILVKLKQAELLPLHELLDITVAGLGGHPVALRNLVDVQSGFGPMSIERKDQERIITISTDMTGRDLSSVISDVRQELNMLPVPQGFSISFGGDYEEQQKAFNELALGLILALVLVYMVMACLYESLRDPFIVMFSVPLAIIGVVLMLFLTDTTFNIQSYIGCIMLGGILVNNAILLVAQTNMVRQEEGYEMFAAIEEVGRRRLRPILMTALTTIFALIPLALGVGEGGEAQAPMARAIIGGLTSSTLITLVFVPVMYTFIARKDEPGNRAQ